LSPPNKNRETKQILVESKESFKTIKKVVET
jgi:hypothetical protein